MLRRRAHGGAEDHGETPEDHGETPTAIPAGPSVSPAAADKLLGDLHAIWEEASGLSVSQHQYTEYLTRAVEQTYGTKKRRRGRRSRWCLVFDCLWTIVLVLFVVGMIVAYCEPISFFLQRNLHTKAYSVNRAARFAFLRVSPYLEAIGLDFTQLCLVSNPFVNESNRCPCIESMEVHEEDVGRLGDQMVLSGAVMGTSDRVFVVRRAVEVVEEYGRGTLVRYVDQYGSLPNMCLVTTSGVTKVGPSNLMEVVNNQTWEKAVTHGGAWDLTWKECQGEEVPLRTMLPRLTFPDDTKLDSSSVYSLAQQWGKGLFHVGGMKLQYDRIVMMVLHGRVRVRVFPSDHCLEYCPPVDPHTLLSAGDALVLDWRYWGYTTHTWSNHSFLMATSFKQDGSHDSK